MTTLFRTTADASSIYRERTAVEVARSYSSSDTGNLAAVTKNSTFECDQVEPVGVAEMPQLKATTTVIG
jgi:hypothetical protein